MICSIKTFKTNYKALLPEKAKDGDSCFDVYGYDFKLNDEGNVTFSTGLKFAIPKGYGISFRSRSGLAFKHGYTCFPGTIDSGYRGELKGMIHLNGQGFEDFRHKVMCESDDLGRVKIAQLFVEKIEESTFDEVETEEDLGTSDRGEGGFGSTGV